MKVKWDYCSVYTVWKNYKMIQTTKQQYDIPVVYFRYQMSIISRGEKTLPGLVSWPQGGWWIRVL